MGMLKIYATLKEAETQARIMNEKQPGYKYASYSTDRGFVVRRILPSLVGNASKFSYDPNGRLVQER